jgi:hypothetical protein
MYDRYVALGDTISMAQILGVLARKGKAYRIRGGASTSFADLRESSAVLLGAFSNDWTLRLTGELRYTFERNPNGSLPHVHDLQNPTDRRWQLANEWPDWKMPLDYAIASRVSDPTTGRAVVIAAGITTYGTTAAGELLTNPAYLAQALRNAPADWKRRNLQIVLSTPVIEGTAGPPKVLATYFW